MGLVISNRLRKIAAEGKGGAAAEAKSGNRKGKNLFIWEFFSKKEFPASERGERG